MYDEEDILDMDILDKGITLSCIQVYDEEDLPDMDIRDILNGLDHTGTASDFSDESHRWFYIIFII